jgi:hypothetical protein
LYGLYYLAKIPIEAAQPHLMGLQQHVAAAFPPKHGCGVAAKLPTYSMQVNDEPVHPTSDQKQS